MKTPNVVSGLSEQLQILPGEHAGTVRKTTPNSIDKGVHALLHVVLP